MQPVPITRQRVTYPLRVAVSRVVDLRSQPWGARFSYAFDPVDADECQLIGAASAWLGLGGLLVQSHRAPGDNLAIFIANLDADDIVEPQALGFDYPPGPPPDHGWPPLDKAPWPGAWPEPRRSISSGGRAEDQVMEQLHDHIDEQTDDWVRLVRRQATLWLGRWPGPHRPGEVIHSTDGGRFVFDHVDPDADGGPEVVYAWVGV